MSDATGPDDVLSAAHGAREVLVAVLSPNNLHGSRDDWALAVRELQSVIDTATAVQDAALVRLAAVEPEWTDDGELVETHRALGHVALDAPAIASGALTVSAVHAERRVRDAVRRAADGPEGEATSTGLGGLHDAMAAGRLDAYRAQVVAAELEEVPPEVARAVVAAVAEAFDTDDAPRLRRRARRVLARISPDLLRQRAVRARSQSSLQRWVDEPGVDTWHGTFPSEEACAAWAAVDALAQQYVTDGTCERVDRARAKALTDLVTGNATIDLQVHVVSAADGPDPERLPGRATDDLVALHGATPGEPVLVSRSWLQAAIAQTTARADRYGSVTLDPATGALTASGDELATDAYRPGACLSRLVKARDGRCRFPGCTVAARFCDLDHVVPWPSGPTSAANLVCLCRRHHRIKQRPGWRAVLHPDATMTWADPTARVRTTHPVDHRSVTLPDNGADTPDPPHYPRLVFGDSPHSPLEFALEHHLGPPPRGRGCRVDLRRPAGRPVDRLRVEVGGHAPRRRPPPPEVPPF